MVLHGKAGRERGVSSGVGEIERREGWVGAVGGRVEWKEFDSVEC